MGEKIIRDSDLAEMCGLSVAEIHYWMRVYLDEAEHFFECTLMEARRFRMRQVVSYAFYYSGALKLLKYFTGMDFKMAVRAMRRLRLLPKILDA